MGTKAEDFKRYREAVDQFQYTEGKFGDKEHISVSVAWGARHRPSVSVSLWWLPDFRQFVFLDPVLELWEGRTGDTPPERVPEQLAARYKQLRDYFDRWQQNEEEWPTCPEDIR